MEQNYCSYCGNQLNTSSIFCEKCGNQVKENHIKQESARILTGKVHPKIKKGAFYTISMYVMGGFFIPFAMILWVLPQLFQSHEGTLLFAPGILLIVGYGVAIWLYSHFFGTTLISKVLVRLTFIVSIIAVPLATFNLFPLLLEFIFVNNNIIKDLGYGGIVSDSDIRKWIMTMIIVIMLTILAYLGIIIVFLKRWFKQTKGIGIKEGIKSLFKPRLNISEAITIIKTLN